MTYEQWKEYCELMQQKVYDELEAENDMLMRQWEEQDDYYNA
jgi:hypothetical protein